ncbi:MAG: hypothetical protein HC817_15445 [Saprospiraceae bacterium]|nr:hypothetical protein [Saprospiraceae bacterium]
MTEVNKPVSWLEATARVLQTENNSAIDSKEVKVWNGSYCINYYKIYTRLKNV